MFQAPYSTTKVTLELRDVLAGGVDLWDFDYPSYYKGEEKKAFEQRVIDHFYFRQIGQETVGRFLHYFRTKVREVMPYYIDMYESVKLFKEQGDPFEAYNLTETFERETTSEADASSSGSSSGNRESRFSKTPQGSVENLDRYLTEANRDTVGDSSSSSSETSGSGTEKYTMTRRGNIGVQPLGQEIKIYREAILNVDMLIIKDLEELFLGVY